MWPSYQIPLPTMPGSADDISRLAEQARQWAAVNSQQIWQQQLPPPPPPPPPPPLPPIPPPLHKISADPSLADKDDRFPGLPSVTGDTQNQPPPPPPKCGPPPPPHEPFGKHSTYVHPVFSYCLTSRYFLYLDNFQPPPHGPPSIPQQGFGKPKMHYMYSCYLHVKFW